MCFRLDKRTPYFSTITCLNRIKLPLGIADEVKTEEGPESM